MTARVLIKTPLCSLTGYGRDGIGLALAFDEAGWDVHLAPTATFAPLPQDVAMLLTKEPNPPYDLLVNHIDPEHIRLTDGERRASKVAVAWTMWEWKKIVNDDVTDTLTERLRAFDAVVAYDPVSGEALREWVPEGTLLLQQQGGFDPSDWPPNYGRDWHDTLRFCMVAQMNPRKDPFVAVEAFAEFQEETGYQSEMHLKTLTPYFHPAMEQQYRGVKIHYAYYPVRKMREFYADKHVLVSTSHGEGKNVPALEAMSTGMTTACTAFGGHTVWQNPAYCFPLAFTEEEVFGAPAAKASKEHLKEIMHLCYRDRLLIRQMGELAARTIPNQCSWTTTISRLLDKLNEMGLQV